VVLGNIVEDCTGKVVDRLAVVEDEVLRVEEEVVVAPGVDRLVL